MSNLHLSGRSRVSAQDSLDQGNKIVPETTRLSPFLVTVSRAAYVFLRESERLQITHFYKP